MARLAHPLDRPSACTAERSLAPALSAFFGRAGLRVRSFKTNPQTVAGTVALVLLLCAAGTLSQMVAWMSTGQHPITAKSPSSQAPRHLEKRRQPIDPLHTPGLNPEVANQVNAATPFVPLGADRPFPLQIQMGSETFARALDCLASAMIYEAGDDPVGQAAVAQVVLNRVRHPAFPKSICGVIYEGSERATGCQFTFTCDGALQRAPNPVAWRRAKDLASMFLAGKIEPRVGMATHYHTDWVHPYWSGSLDKIQRVGTHLFFRWRGSWGRKAAFSGRYTGAEPLEPKLAMLSAAHILARSSQKPPADSAEQGNANGADTAPTVLTPRSGDHFVLVDAGGDGTELALQGLNRCSGERYCKIVGWDRRSKDYGSPDNPLIRTVAFLYVTDKRTGVEIVLWDCTRFNRPSDSQCLSDRNRRWIGFQGDLSRAT